MELRKEGRQTFCVWGRKDKREKGEGEDEEKYDNEGGMKQGWNGKKGERNKEWGKKEEKKWGKVSFQALGSGNSVNDPYKGWCVEL